MRVTEETARAGWTAPTETRRRRTVPDLWRSYDRIRPTPETVAADGKHGSAYISVRVLILSAISPYRISRPRGREYLETVTADSMSILRDEAALAVDRGGGIGEVHGTAEALLDARPSMVALETRVNRAVSGARGPEEAERAAAEGIERTLAVDERAAECAAETVGGHVLTLSRSGTVLAAP